MDDRYLALALLFGGVALFLLSTRQGPIWLRLSIVAGGVALLVAAGAQIAGADDHFGLLRMVGDLWVHRATPEDSVIAVALARNEAQIVGRMIPLLDLFLIFAGLIGLVALAALTPGYTAERIAQAMQYGLFGAIAGAALALSVVAVGFGGASQLKVYTGTVANDDVYDGDTFWIGETQVRLYGVDAPERRQTCLQGEHCGELARQALAGILEKGLVTCAVKENAKGRVVESFGRPLVTCEVRPEKGPNKQDVGKAMIQAGLAGVYDKAQFPEYARVRPARNAAKFCWLEPKRFRRDRAAREAFLAGRTEHGFGFGCPAKTRARPPGTKS